MRLRPVLPRSGAALLLLAPLACGEPARSAPPPPAIIAQRLSRPDTLRGAVYAAGPTTTVDLSPVDTTPKESSLTFATPGAACDALEPRVRAAFPNTTRDTVRRRNGVPFEYWYAKVTGTGCRIEVRGSFDQTVEDDNPMGRLWSMFERMGWVTGASYSADGPDGSVIGFYSRETLCTTEGRWDGGDDSEEELEAIPPGAVDSHWYEFDITCVPRRADDVPPR